MLLIIFIPFEINADELHMEVMLEIGYDYCWDIINTDIDLELHIPLFWGLKAIGYGGVETPLDSYRYAFLPAGNKCLRYRGKPTNR